LKVANSFCSESVSRYTKQDLSCFCFEVNCIENKTKNETHAPVFIPALFMLQRGCLALKKMAAVNFKLLSMHKFMHKSNLSGSYLLVCLDRQLHVRRLFYDVNENMLKSNAKCISYSLVCKKLGLRDPFCN